MRHKQPERPRRPAFSTFLTIPEFCLCRSITITKEFYEAWQIPEKAALQLMESAFYLFTRGYDFDAFDFPEERMESFRLRTGRRPHNHAAPVMFMQGFELTLKMGLAEAKRAIERGADLGFDVEQIERYLESDDYAETLELEKIKQAELEAARRRAVALQH